MSHSDEIVSTPREVLWAWANRKLRTPWSEDFRAVGRVIDNELKAVVVYNGFVGKVCCMHAAIDSASAIDREFIRAVFEYPFEQLGLKYLLAPVEAENSLSNKLVQHLGFTRILELPAGGADGDLFIYRMAAPEYLEPDEHRNRLFWRLKNGQIIA